MSRPPAAESSPLDPAKIDEAVLALLHLNATTERLGGYTVTRAWKSLNWDALDRLHEAGLISEPWSKAKSVVMTEEGAKRAEETCHRLFSRNSRREQIEESIADSVADNRKALEGLA